jgi:hypothetical protein
MRDAVLRMKHNLDRCEANRSFVLVRNRMYL